MDIIAIPGFSEPFSSWTHLLSAGVALIGAFFLHSRGKGNRSRIVGLWMFSCATVFMFAMSGVYHLLEPGHAPRYVLRVLDHAAIWVMIAGTLTPFQISLFRGFKRWGILGIVWILTVLGITLGSVFFDSLPEWLTLSFFLIQGWFGMVSFYLIKKYYKRELDVHLIYYGGAAYSIGAILEFARWPVIWPGVIGPHEIFHIAVIMGAAFHWRFVYQISNNPVSEKLTIHVKEFPNNVYRARATTEWVEFHASSVEDLRAQIKVWVEKSFHETLAPEKIKLKFFREERL